MWGCLTGNVSPFYPGLLAPDSDVTAEGDPLQGLPKRHIEKLSGEAVGTSPSTLEEPSGVPLVVLPGQIQGLSRSGWQRLGSSSLIV